MSTGRILLAAVLIAVMPGCGEEGGGSSNDGSGGATGGTRSGGTGGDSTGGGTGGTVASGGLGGSGASPTGGGGTLPPSGGSGGSDDLTSRIGAACSNWQANGFVIGCTGVFAGTYVQDCTDALVLASATCRAEVVAVLDCAAMLSPLDYACAADGSVTLAAGVCETESAALDLCVGEAS